MSLLRLIWQCFARPDGGSDLESGMHALKAMAQKRGREIELHCAPRKARPLIRARHALEDAEALAAKTGRSEVLELPDVQALRLIFRKEAK